MSSSLHLWFINSRTCLVQVSLDNLALETSLRCRRTNIFQLTIAAARPIPCAAADTSMIFPSSRPILLTCADRCHRIFNEKVSQQYSLTIRCKYVPKTRHDSENLCHQIVSQIVLFGCSVTPSHPEFWGGDCLNQIKRHLSSKAKLYYNRNWTLFFLKQKKSRWNRSIIIVYNLVFPWSIVLLESRSVFYSA